MSEKAKFPTRLRTTNIPHFLTVSLENNNEITNHSLHSASICGNVPIPLQAHYFYFEIEMKNVEKGYVSVGLIPEYQFLSEALLGKKYGYGLRSDGRLFSPMNPSGIDWSFCSQWGSTVGDTVGCGIIFETGQVFYTKGTKCCGIAFTLPPEVMQKVLSPTLMKPPRTKNLSLPTHTLNDVHMLSKSQQLVPCVTVGANRVVSVNFGTKYPFVFDIANFVMEKEHEVKETIMKIGVSDNMMHQMVTDYLLFNGYGDTLSALQQAGTTSNSANIDTAKSDSNINDGYMDTDSKLTGRRSGKARRNSGGSKRRSRTPEDKSTSRSTSNHSKKSSAVEETSQQDEWVAGEQTGPCRRCCFTPLFAPQGQRRKERDGDKCACCLLPSSASTASRENSEVNHGSKEDMLGVEGQNKPSNVSSTPDCQQPGIGRVDCTHSDAVTNDEHNRITLQWHARPRPHTGPYSTSTSTPSGDIRSTEGEEVDVEEVMLVDEVEEEDESMTTSSFASLLHASSVNRDSKTPGSGNENLETPPMNPFLRSVRCGGGRSGGATSAASNNNRCGNESVTSNDRRPNVRDESDRSTRSIRVDGEIGGLSLDDSRRLRQLIREQQDQDQTWLESPSPVPSDHARDHGHEDSDSRGKIGGGVWSTAPSRDVDINSLLFSGDSPSAGAIGVSLPFRSRMRTLLNTGDVNGVIQKLLEREEEENTKLANSREESGTCRGLGLRSCPTWIYLNVMLFVQLLQKQRSTSVESSEICGGSMEDTVEEKEDSLQQETKQDVPTPSPTLHDMNPVDQALQLAKRELSFLMCSNSPPTEKNSDCDGRFIHRRIGAGEMRGVKSDHWHVWDFNARVGNGASTTGGDAGGGSSAAGKKRSREEKEEHENEEQQDDKSCEGDDDIISNDVMGDDHRIYEKGHISAASQVQHPTIEATHTSSLTSAGHVKGTNTRIEGGHLFVCSCFERQVLSKLVMGALKLLLVPPSTLMQLSSQYPNYQNDSNEKCGGTSSSTEAIKKEDGLSFTDNNENAMDLSPSPEEQPAHSSHVIDSLPLDFFLSSEFVDMVADSVNMHILTSDLAAVHSSSTALMSSACSSYHTALEILMAQLHCLKLASRRDAAPSSSSIPSPPSPSSSRVPGDKEHQGSGSGCCCDAVSTSSAARHERYSKGGQYNSHPVIWPNCSPSLQTE